MRGSLLLNILHGHELDLQNRLKECAYVCKCMRITMHYFIMSFKPFVLDKSHVNIILSEKSLCKRGRNDLYSLTGRDALCGGGHRHPQQCNALQ